MPVPSASHLPILVRRVTGRLVKCKFRVADGSVARNEVRGRPPAAGGAQPGAGGPVDLPIFNSVLRLTERASDPRHA